MTKLDLDIVQLLLDNGLDVEARDSDGRTPLHYASGMKYSGATMGAWDIIKCYIKMPKYKKIKIV